MSKRELRQCVEYCRQQNGLPHCKNCGLDDDMITSAINEERRAWLNGERCHECGEPMKPHPTTNTCPKCWEEN